MKKFLNKLLKILAKVKFILWVKNTEFNKKVYNNKIYLI